MTIHLLDETKNRTFCGGGIIGDKAITLEQAHEPDNDMYFDCIACYIVVGQEDTHES